METFQPLPRDLIGKILNFYDDFQTQAAIQRKREFDILYGPVWSNVLSDVRANVPAYRVSVINYEGLNINIFFRLPDCDVKDFRLRALFNSWTYTLNRSALGLPRQLFYLQQQ
ncbi:MAG: hypothetical protein EBT86_01275 [Actinobacteria bacterium]|nr:hypothetical protein [Actinomycetota bacterium]